MIVTNIDTSHGTILYLDDVSVNFDGYRALNKLSLVINEGELRCVIGPNGAGKTTMMDVITGKTAANSGSAYLGQRLNLFHYTEAEIANLGIGRKFQKPTVFDQLSVFDNLALALRGSRSVWSTLTSRLNSHQIQQIDEVLSVIQLNEQRQKLAGTLSHGQKQWLELGMLLAQDPKLLLIDEPVAGMTQQETDRTAELLLSLAGTHSILLVEHDMDFVRSIASTVTVLHEGQVLAEGSMNDVQADQRVRQVYLGE